jgi:hypothetical protein
MRKSRLIKGHWPQRKDRKTKITYKSEIPPRDWKYWLVVALLVIFMGVLVYVLLKAA